MTTQDAGPQREPDERVREAQRDDHPTDLEHPRPRETAASSLSVDTSVADRKDAARYRWLRKLFWWDDEPGLNPSWTARVFTPRHQQIPLHAAIDAAMSADVRSDFVSPVSSPDQTLPAPSAVAQWLPIESAPRCRDVLVVYEAAFGPRVVQAEQIDRPSAGGWTWHCDIGRIDPTHWMPLPEPPKDVRSQAKDTQGREATASDDQDDTKSAARPEPTR